MKGFKYILSVLVILLMTSLASAQEVKKKAEVIPMQVLDLTKMSNEDRIKWIVVKGKLEMPVIVEVAGGDSDDLFVLVGKTMRGLQHGGLSNLVLLQSNGELEANPSDEKVWLYLNDKVTGVLKPPKGTGGIKALLQRKIMRLYDRAHGTNFYPYDD